jgi:glutaredoxin
MKPWTWLFRPKAARAAPVQIVFYTRAGCHLCEQAHELLLGYEERNQLRIREIDIDTDPELAARHGERVPVLEIGGRPRLWGKINRILLERLLHNAQGPR